MVKRFSVLLLLGIMIVSLFTGCAKSTGSTSQSDGGKTEENQGDKKVGFLIPTTSSGFFAMLAGEFEKAFKESGYEFSIGISDWDSKKQIEQIENMITLKMDTIIVMAADPSSLGDVLSKAQNAGIKVINFTTDPGVGDIFVGADEEIVGKTVVEIASEWIDEQFPDAKDGSIKVAIMENRDTPEASHRSNGFKNISKLNKKVKVEKTLQVVNTTKDAQAAAENLFLTNPDLNVVIAYNSGMALGVNAYAMTPGSAIKDKAKFAIFGADQDEEILSNIKASLDDQSVIRGATQIGGDIKETIVNVVKYSDQLLAGEKTIERDIAPIIKISTENIDEFLK